MSYLETFTFTMYRGHKVKTVEVDAMTLEDAQAKFQERFGFFPSEENLKIAQFE